jgi:hypothetical protein
LIPGEKSNGFGKRESGGGTTTLHKIVRFFLEKKVQEAALSYYNEDTYQDGLPPEKIRKNGCKIIH